MGRGRTEETDGETLRHREWERLAAGLVAGITRAGAGTFSISASMGDDLHAAYAGLADRTGFRTVAVPRQVHGTGVVPVRLGALDGVEGTVLLMGRVDGLVTASAGVLLASTAADCVPVYLLDPDAKVVGLVHAGWRGVAGSILDRGLDALAGEGGDPGRAHVHLGPAICGSCYEVDQPVLRHFGSTDERALLDLRGALVEQALLAGVAPGRVTVSTHCTSCGAADLHSHRASGGEAGRMAAFAGFARLH